jgi:hypothetical protein
MLIVSKRVKRSSAVIKFILESPNIEAETERFNESFELQHYIAKKRINER